MKAQSNPITHCCKPHWILPVVSYAISRLFWAAPLHQATVATTNSGSFQTSSAPAPIELWCQEMIPWGFHCLYHGDFMVSWVFFRVFFREIFHGIGIRRIPPGKFHGDFTMKFIGFHQWWRVRCLTMAGYPRRKPWETGKLWWSLMTASFVTLECMSMFNHGDWDIEGSEPQGNAKDIEAFWLGVLLEILYVAPELRVICLLEIAKFGFFRGVLRDFAWLMHVLLWIWCCEVGCCKNRGFPNIVYLMHNASKTMRFWCTRFSARPVWQLRSFRRGKLPMGDRLMVCYCDEGCP